MSYEFKAFGTFTHVFVSLETSRPMEIPSFFKSKLKEIVKSQERNLSE